MSAGRDSKIKRWGACWREWRIVLRSRRKLAVALLLFVLLPGAYLIQATQPLYESSLKILLARSPQFEATPDTLNQQAQAISLEELNTEIELLTSGQVLDEVLRETHPDSMPGLHQWMLSRLKVVTIRPAPLLQVSFRDEDAERVTQVLTTLFQKYTEHRQRLFSQGNRVDELRAQAAASNRQLAAATEKLRQFVARHNLAATETQRDLLVQQLSAWQGQASAMLTERSGLQQRVATLRQQLVAQPERIETSSITKQVQALDKMKLDLIALEMQHTQLLQKYLPEHRLVRDLETRIAQARELIAREEKNPSRESAVSLNETHRRVANDLLEAEAALASVTQREKKLNELVSQERARLTELEQHSYRKSELERERAMQEETWQLYQRRMQQIELGQVAQQSGALRATLTESPAPASIPLNYRAWFQWLTLLLAGSLFSMTGCLLAELRRPRVRSEAGLQRRFGLTVLARVPVSRRMIG